VVSYDQRGTGNNGGRRKATAWRHGAGAAQALAGGGIARFALVGHALGALIGLQLALDIPSGKRPGAGQRLADALPHTRRCFQVRERLLHAGGAQAWVEAQPLFLYPADWMAARLPRLEAEEALAIRPFPGQREPAARLNALKQADFQPPGGAHSLPDADHQRRRRSAGPGLLLPRAAGGDPGSQQAEMRQGGHACNVTEPPPLTPILLNGLAAMLPAL
jgi:aminoacrylate hydrolase